MMRLAIVAHGLHVAGGKSVAINIIRTLIEEYPSYEYLFIVPDLAEYKSIPYPDNALVKYFSGGAFNRLIFDRYQLNNSVNKFRPDLIWCLGNYGLYSPPCPQAILLHKPHLVGYHGFIGKEVLKNRLKNFLLKVKLRKSLLNTQLVFCQTNTMMLKFSKTYGYEGKTSLLPNAISKVINKPNPILMDEIKKIVASDKILFVLTRYYPHKNLELLVECFDKYRSDLSGVKCVITIDPTEHKYAKKLLSKIKTLGLNIVNVGPINHSDIASYYSVSDALLLPTLLESFSGTYVEAMKYSCPIITSDLDFAREICRDSALYFTPNDSLDMKNKILEFYASPNLRDSLADAGKNRLQLYVKSWDEIVSSGIKDIKSVINR